MKKLLLAAFLFVFVLNANSQVKFGIKAGVNFAKMSESESGVSITTDALVGFHAGVIADIGIGPIAIQPGVLFTQKGGKIMSETMKLNYLDIPVNLVYKISAGPAKVLLNAGPSFSYGLSGTASGESVTFGSGVNDVKKMDFGIGFGGGVQLGSIVASLNYNIGLSNISNDTNFKVRNNVFSISLAYMFGGI